MPQVRLFFVFAGEGSSDDAIVSHLEKLCIVCGADEATGVATDWGRLPSKPSRKVEDKIADVIQLEPHADLIFIHRDADARDPEPRREEIRKALRKRDLRIPGIAVVPVQEMEAWLLLDEEEIRQVAENPNSHVSLNLPIPSRVGELANPKKFLDGILLNASELSGRRRDKFKRTLPQRRRLLLERLEPEGKITEVPAWQQLRADLEREIRTFRET